MPRNAGRAVIQTLTGNGVKTVFGIPGVHNLPIYDALPDFPELRHILVRQEQGAAFMADGFARASGKPGVCFLASGPGSTNALTAVSEAYLDSSPVVVIAGGIPTASRGTDSIHEVDQWAMYKPVTKWQSKPRSADEVPSAVQSALTSAMTGRPRPTYVEIPYDLLSQHCESEPAAHTVSVHSKHDERAVRDATEILARSRYPVIIGGGGVVSAGAYEEVLRLANLLVAPVVTTMLGRGIVPEDHPLAAGFTHDSVGSSLLREADVVLALGCRFSESSFRAGKSGPLPMPGRLIHVDIDPREIGKTYPPFIGIVGDAKEVALRLAEELERSQPTRTGKIELVTKNMSRLRAERDMRFSSKVDASDIPLKPQRVMKELAAVAPRDTIFSCDSGNNTWWTHFFLRAYFPRSFMTPAGNWAMGFSFPAALGAKMAKPERSVVSVIGDGGFLMTCQELGTAVQHKIPITVVILDNGLHGAIRNYQRYVYGSHFVSIAIEKVDFAKLAESFGAEGISVERPSELAEAFKYAMKCGEPCVLGVKVDPSEEIPEWLIDRFYRG